MTSPKHPKTSPAEVPSRSVWIVVAVVAVVGIAAVIAIVSRSSNKAPSGGQALGTAGTVVTNGSTETAPVAISGTALPPAVAAGQADPAVGLAAPTVKGVDFSGAPAAIGNDAKPKVIMFLAHWCPHCQAEVPRIEKWLVDNGMPKDVALYSVATGTDAARPNYPPSNWLVGQQWTVPVLVDSAKSEAANAYGLTGFPYFVAIGSDGKVVTRASGELPVADFVKLIDAARAGKVQ